jgi:antitoxin component of MazEF toxin-antitoxin module
MINTLTYSKTIRKTGKMLVIPVPKEIADKMELKEKELIEVKITKLE